MASAIPISYSSVVPSVPGAIGAICTKLLSELKAANFSREDIFAVHLALEEAFVNAVEHGNDMDPTKKIEIEYSVGRDKVKISLTDEGQGFDPDAVPDPRCGENLYKTEGRGLLLIRSYMDTVKYNKRGNHIQMVKRKSSVKNIA